MTLEDVVRSLGALPEADRKAVVDLAIASSPKDKWTPNPGPQTQAYLSPADVLLYGGEPGGGKSQLILGLAFNKHERSLIMRREYGDLERLIEDALKINGGREGFNGSPPPRLRISERQQINFRAAQRIGDEQGTMGQGRDLLGIDEATHFAESQIRFLMGWVRTETPGQRCRTVLATNPPLTAEGLWVNKMFAPWLDPKYPYPAKPGELRWVLSNEEGKDEWVNGPDDTRVVKGRVVSPMSRTYIPASVEDNPEYAANGYQRQLDNMDEPYRSLLLGGFRTTFKDDEFQVIPTAWIEAAQARWNPDGYKDFTMTAMALDPAGGGGDAQVLCWRHGPWYAPLVTKTGPETAEGSTTGLTVVKHWLDAAPVVVDQGGGYGGAVTPWLTKRGVAVVSFNGANQSTAKAKGGKLSFVNKRAEAWWKFREELDPDQYGGASLALPHDPELLADLATPTFDVTSRGIQIEAKDKIRKRIGRSPGKGDAVVMCLSEGNAAVKRELRKGGQMPQVNLGYADLKKRH